MERVATLREQASVLRALARSFDIAPIRNQLSDLADRCEELAESIEAHREKADTGPAPTTARQR